ncbi:MAG: c-type cytochrome, partial [Dehalococcoidia bacterium]
MAEDYMQMSTIRRGALFGLVALAMGVTVGCTALGDAAEERRIEAQMELAERAGYKPGEGAPAATQTAGGNASDPAALGKTVATANGCVACHTIDGKASVGPTWKGLAGKTGHELADGSSVTVDDAYLKESITTPNAKVVKGFAANVMPATFGNTLKPEQIDQIIAYIKTLKYAPPASAGPADSERARSPPGWRARSVSGRSSRDELHRCS